jgi:hypothetical protein
MADDLVLEILKAIQSDIARLTRDVAALTNDMTEVKTELPAMRRDIAILVQDGRMIRTALNDLGLTRVSAGEVEAIHTDINALFERMSRVEAATGLLK